MVAITRSDIEIKPDFERVVARPFLPGEPSFAGGRLRVELIADRVLELDDVEAKDLLASTSVLFEDRHSDLESVWEQNIKWAEGLVPKLGAIEGDRRKLLGAFFTQEYAPEAAAVCNPSMVRFPDGERSGNFIMSLRAIGEGHISSVEFRTGSIDDSGVVAVDEPGKFLSLGQRRAPDYDKRVFSQKLLSLGGDAALVDTLMTPLPDHFSAEELDSALKMLDRGDVSPAAVFETRKLAHWLASSNYELVYPEAVPISERILLPSSPAESHGIEDARFVRFVDDVDDVTYYATYTAFDGFTILPQLIETKDFQTFRIETLNGTCARNKGMALFPRKVDGLYAALGRHDQENLHLLRSDQIRVWDHAELIAGPDRGWETVQIGSCGSPIETDEGWLVLTHGVGPMRRYTMGAILLDLADPSQLIGRLDTPLLEPDPDERSGYVPNVVYSCGGIIHGDWLVVPYGYSDQRVRLMTVVVEELLEALR